MHMKITNLYTNIKISDYLKAFRKFYIKVVNFKLILPKFKPMFELECKEAQFHL